MLGIAAPENCFFLPFAPGFNVALEKESRMNIWTTMKAIRAAQSVTASVSQGRAPSREALKVLGLDDIPTQRFKR